MAMEYVEMLHPNNVDWSITLRFVTELEVSDTLTCDCTCPLMMVWAAAGGVLCTTA